MKHRIVIATGNKDKMREVREIFADLDAEILSMKEAGCEADPEENGTTFAENAMIKAEAVHALCPDAIVMADDSGLVVDYLNGEPGIWSARWLGRDTPYSVKNAEIIRRLEGVEGDARSARFTAAIACILPDGRRFTTTANMLNMNDNILLLLIQNDIQILFLLKFVVYKNLYHSYLLDKI